MRWRSNAQFAVDPAFALVPFIQKVLEPQLKGGLVISLTRRKDWRERPASVTFDPLTLHVDERTWRQAQSVRLDGHEDARHVLAHEIGHIVLHRDQRMAFSNLDGSGMFFVPEESSERQANLFARYFLIRDWDVVFNPAADTLAAVCRVPRELAQEAVDELKASQQAPDEFCARCGNLARLRAGRALCLTCDAEETTQTLSQHLMLT